MYISVNAITKINQELLQRKDEKSALETELAIFKNTDLGKEVEILQLKLDAKEKERAEIQKNFTMTSMTLTTLRDNLKRIPNITRALSLMSGTFGKQPPVCFNATDRASIDRELSIVGDVAWQEKWSRFIADTDSKNCSMSPQQFFTAVDYGFEKIASLVRQ
ncbi:MAG: hypothetical protein Q7K44_00090 [Candidatus Liptonbacteria bacterium]|nr:hypothetical protein [Candidatus Liptonbacteria bacterium]